MTNITGRFSAVTAALNEWVGDARVISRNATDDYGTLIWVTVDADGEYRVLRGFGIGEEAHVSVDKATTDVDAAISYLASLIRT